MLIIGRKFDINIKMLKEWLKAARKDLSEKCVSKIWSLGIFAQVINEI